MNRQWKMKSKFGTLYLVASENAVRGILWERQDAPMAESLAGPDPATRMLARAVRQLDEYFSGKRKEFDLPLAVEGTAFQKRVWAELAKIPYGRTFSYREIARKIGKPAAVRAVGTANGRNPISIVVPCHRVIAADGTLGGYAGGLPFKSKLLALESGG